VVWCRPGRCILAQSLKCKARDADRVGLLHEVVQGFQPFLEPGWGEALGPEESRARVG
jgi:hypothetical protein